MPKFHIILENSAGKLDEGHIFADECSPELTEFVASFVYAVSQLRDGDTIRIVEILDVEMPEDDRIQPHASFKYLRADEVAECWEGVGEELYAKLWKIVLLQKPIPNIEDSGPADHVGHENLAAHWQALSLADQIELNAMAAREERRMGFDSE